MRGHLYRGGGNPDYRSVLRMVLIVSVFFFGFLYCIGAIPAAETRTYPVQFVKCYDGDTCTFNVVLGFHQVAHEQEVRFCDIDAPEINPLVSREAATVARDWVIAQLKGAQKIVIWVVQKDGCAAPTSVTCDKRDSLKRWLVFVIADGVNLNQRLLELGLVQPFREKCL